MPDLSFHIEGVEPVLFAASPLLAFKTRVTNRIAGERVRSGMLRCRVDIDPARRVHDADERDRLHDLFDRPERWGRTLRALPWAEVVLYLPSFQDSVVVDVLVPCSGDLELSTTRYLFGLRGGDVNVGLSFRGTVLHDSNDRGLQVALTVQDEASRVRLPLNTWREMMDHYYPNSGWLRLRSDLYERLSRHKTLGGHATLEQALDSLLTGAEGGP
ncbi:DUF6084 family protein [Paludisphaera mucosa]|uniref:DUF6084 family protein n=1 Tax=Paludisphaera mucosa TaxID=3030827 RepID=A0ABT6FD33_9BACT|nr:DUF6084 family protein [Paludisphaera mucosa]MDG3005447.1 DUF6084 family protein [Paludisphaera mucosa]